MDAKDGAVTPSDKAKVKRREKYDRPVMVVYGDIRAITRATSPTGMGDGGMAGTVKSV